MRTTARDALAELVGSALLAATVVGSGIAATRLTDDVALQLLVNALVTGAVLVALISTLHPVSAAFNPVVTLVERALGLATTRGAAALVSAQVAGCALGVVVANAMHDLDPVVVSTTERTGSHLWLAEVVATFGLVLVVFGTRAPHLPYAVAGWVTAAYWATSSTSFANPALTLGRTLSDTFAGIDPASVPAFVAFQLLGGAVALAAVRALFVREPA